MMKLRKDVKTGLVVAGGVLAVGVIYVALGRKGDDAKQANAGSGGTLITDSPEKHGDEPLTPPGGDGRKYGADGQLITEGTTTDVPAKPIESTPTKQDPIAPTTPVPTTPQVATGETDPNDPWAEALFKNKLPALAARPQQPESLPGTPESTGTETPLVTSDPAPRVIVDPTPAAPGSHTIAAGETIAAIAKHYYGSERASAAILKANPNVVAERLKIGTVINLPDVKETASAAPASAAPVAEKALDGQTEYKVRSGDSLHRIARNLYGDDRQWQAILDANKGTLSDPAKLKVGQVLKLPTPPTSPTASR